MSRFKASIRGFTLIELLIVVAIIAILAAIAVPNFLEAQTRAKVSRTQADMRSLATALEAYYVDSNDYPPDFSQVIRTPGVVTNPINRNYSTLMGRLSHLTTPVSYITSVPADIFAEQVAAGGATRYDGTPLASTPYREGAAAGGAIIRPIVYDYAQFDRKRPPFDSVTIWARITTSPESVAWALNSPGPDTRTSEYLGNLNLTVYDPTNGTSSKGQIIRTNLGTDDKPKAQ